MREPRRPEKFDISVEIIIVGAGPAGRWLGVHLARQGMSVAFVDPHPHENWTNTYGVWLDEVQRLVPGPCFRRTWEAVRVCFGQQKTVERAYGLIDNASFRRTMDAELRNRGVRFVEGVVRQVQRRGEKAVAYCDDGRRLKARVVVDASGGKAKLAKLAATPEVAYQRAYGMVARFDGDPLEGAAMVLMDYGKTRRHHDSVGGPPTFLYGMHLGEGLYFVEETVLLSQEAVNFEWLRDRLLCRLEERGVTMQKAIRHEERCHIPMGIPLTHIQGPVVPFGASAGLVHPATGYQMGRMLRAAPRVAKTLARGRRAGLVGEPLARRAWRTCWPAGVCRARQLLVFGRDVLLSLNRRQLCRFFDAFFDLPVDDWRDYLLGDVEFRRLSQVMWRLFERVDNELKWLLVQRAVTNKRQLLGAFFPR